MDNKLSIPVARFESTNETLENTNFKKVKILIMHTGENLNGSVFSVDSINNSINTLSNIPILGYVVKDDSQNKDFAGHETDFDIFTDEDGKIKVREYYKEQPIGVIPETNDYFTEVINGETYLGCYGYVWKCYSNDAYDILEEDQEKEISMEILIKSCTYDRKNLCHIDKFEFLGITVLGANVPGAMGSLCTINMNFSTDEENQEFTKSVDKLNKLLKCQRKEGQGVKIEDNANFADEEVCPTCKKNPCECNTEEEACKKKKCSEDDVEENACKKKNNSEDDVDENACKKKNSVEDSEDNACKKKNNSEDKEDNACGTKKKCSEEDDVEEEACKTKKCSTEDSDDNACKKKCSEDEVDENACKKKCSEDKEEEACGNKKKCSEEDDVDENACKKKCSAEEFALSLNNTFRAIRKCLEDYTYEYTSFWGDTYTRQKYYIEDLIPNNSVAVLYDCEEDECYGVKYSLDNDDVVINIDSKVLYIQEWRPKEDGFSKFECEKVKAEDEIFEVVGKELQELREFKAEIEAQKDKEEFDAKVEAVLSQFNFDEEEISDLVEKVENKLIDIDMFETCLFALEAKKARAEKEKFSSRERENSLNVVDNTMDNNRPKSKYSAILKEYGKKNK